MFPHKGPEASKGLSNNRGREGGLTLVLSRPLDGAQTLQRRRGVHGRGRDSEGLQGPMMRPILPCMVHEASTGPRRKPASYLNKATLGRYDAT